MNKEDMSNVQKLTLSAMVIALYVTVLACTQSFSFGAYQIRIATSLYALSYLFPFLVFPLGLANFIANMLFGGLGIIDMIGGCLVGILTTALITGIHRFKWNPCLMILPIILVPGLGVSVWLSFLLHMPYPALAFSLCIGQIIPAICGFLLVKALEHIVGTKHVKMKGV